MSSRAKIKGTRVENQIVAALNAGGIQAERVPGSGLFGGDYAGDVCIPNVKAPLFRGEVKARKEGQGFKVLEKWIGDNDLMFLKRNHATPLVVLQFDIFVQLMSFYMNNRNISLVSENETN